MYHKLLYIHDCIIFNSSFITNTAKSSNKIYLTFHARDRNINIRPPLSPEPFVETENSRKISVIESPPLSPPKGHDISPMQTHGKCRDRRS